MSASTLRSLDAALVVVAVLVVVLSLPAQSRSYNNGLIFYDLQTHNLFLPPTVSVSRGRRLAGLQYSAKGSIWSTFGKPCECSGPVCGCCAGITVQQYSFDQKMCANVTFVPEQHGALLDIFLNEKPSARYGISARNPSPFCIPVMLGVPMAMCVQMSDIAVQGNNLNMCMDFIVRLASTDLFEMHFQCMRMGLDGLQYLDKNGQPVLTGGNRKKQSAEDDDYYDEDAETLEGDDNNDVNSAENQVESGEGDVDDGENHDNDDNGDGVDGAGDDDDDDDEAAAAVDGGDREVLHADGEVDIDDFSAKVEKKHDGNTAAAVAAESVNNSRLVVNATTTPVAPVAAATTSTTTSNGIPQIAPAISIAAASDATASFAIPTTTAAATHQPLLPTLSKSNKRHSKIFNYIAD